MFVKSYKHSLDAKKRLTIPREWRAAVGQANQLFVLPSINERYLCVYPAREMTHRLEKFRSLSIADERGRHLARTLAARSDLVTLDAQGRIRIADELLEYAEIKHEVKLIGAFDRFEVWSPEKWKLHETSEALPTLGEAVQYVGF
jgi:MraZ protein